MSAPIPSRCWWRTCWAGAVEPVFEDSEQTRLGAGFYDTHRLQPEAIAETARAVASSRRRRGRLNAVSTRVIATSAARDAVNPTESDFGHRGVLRVEGGNHFRRTARRTGRFAA